MSTLSSIRCRPLTLGAPILFFTGSIIEARTQARPGSVAPRLLERPRHMALRSVNRGRVLVPPRSRKRGCCCCSHLSLKGIIASQQRFACRISERQPATYMNNLLLTLGDPRPFSLEGR
jgi:hypothetical protein